MSCTSSVTTPHISNRPTFTPDARCKTQNYSAPGCGMTIRCFDSRRPGDPSAALPLRRCYIDRLTSWIESPGVPLDSHTSFPCCNHIQAALFLELLRDVNASQNDYFVVYCISNCHHTAMPGVVQACTLSASRPLETSKSS